MCFEDMQLFNPVHSDAPRHRDASPAVLEVSGTERDSHRGGPLPAPLRLATKPQGFIWGLSGQRTWPWCQDLFLEQSPLLSKQLLLWMTTFFVPSG